jgi:CheY-like chemotaxis protein
MTRYKVDLVSIGANPHMGKVLIIDDDPMVRFTVSQILAQGGFAVIAATNGRRGMALLRTEQPAIVITDLMMPEQDGIETIIQLRREHPAIKILAISGGQRMGNLDILGSAQKLGAHDMIAKPFSAEELLTRLERLMSSATPPALAECRDIAGRRCGK